jgi:hypothetical protein
MTTYLLNVALIITGCLAFYKLLLQKETFYRLNRFVLMACLAIAFALPLLPVPQQLSLKKTSTPTQFQNTRPPKNIVNQPQVAEPIGNNTVSSNTLIDWMVYLYWFGVVVFGINFIVQLLVLLLRAYRNPVIIDGIYRIVEIKGDKPPCSFGNTIFINPEKYEWETYNQILQHEKVHIREKHSLDLVFAELVLIFQWFNPFAWLYRKEIENNLEFLTDEVLVEKEAVEKSGYQLSLLKVSTPQLPLHLTTNYNQSLLKKRIAMMNAKKSNLHTTWKYFFLVPLMLLFASLFNEPVAKAQGAEKNNQASGTATEGYWFATIKGDQINMQFKEAEGDNNSSNSSSFKRSDFTNLPQGTSAQFTLTREAGVMEFTGKFEGNQGMGKYKFIANKSYSEAMKTALGEPLGERDAMVFFFIDIKTEYVKMLSSAGFTDLDKDKVIPLAALQIDADYIQSLKESGLKGLDLDQLIPLKSLNIDKKYIQEIRAAGYPDISSDQLIALKSQNIDGAYVKKMHKTNDPDDLMALKALQIDDTYVNELKQAGFSNISQDDLVAMKSLGITGDFIKSFTAAGYKNIEVSDLIALKSQNITPAFIKGFEEIGYKDIKLDEFVGLKAMGVTPAYIKQMKGKGFNYTDVNKYLTLKALDH